MAFASFPEQSSRVHSGSTPDALHRELGQLAHMRLLPQQDAPGWLAALPNEQRLRRLEHGFIESERVAVRVLAQQAPTDAAGFVAWFEALQNVGAGQGDVLFPWLAEHASLAQMKWFLCQELAGEAGFDDLVALTQLRLPEFAKLELARNYWDEMGRGIAGAMHGPMLQRLAADLELSCSTTDAVWEALALANLMLGLAANRHYAFQSIGALGVIELTAPGRSALVNAGLQRLGVRGEARRYYALHATLDLKHAAAWTREVLRGLVSSDPRSALPIAEGALLRLRAGARCFERYRRELGVGVR